MGVARLLVFRLQEQVHLSIKRRGITIGMTAQTNLLAAPRSLVEITESRALAGCPAVTRAVGRIAADSEAFWFTAWDWDTQTIWTTVRRFFDSYNSGRYADCLNCVAADEDTGEVMELLKRAKSSHQHVSVEAITDLVIAGSRANGTVDQIVGSEVVRQNMSFVKEGGSWKISWPILWIDADPVTESWSGGRGESTTVRGPDAGLLA